ncbi:permease prefix domain 1-containing protein [Streptomyces megasporus]|uniref:permease prefix domain 1-containing protein n=1 Tax=Streptomyces megasporus TaxID=44060 RepID=UPI0004E1EA0C|nr:permease prefix domain 1-containing protein [Streptomyces megasporus]
MTVPTSADSRRDDPVEDPVEKYVATLSGALRGPARLKGRLVEEIRDGLDDTVAAYMREGASYERAAREAVREFGTPDGIAPSCQRELTIAQARHTARVAALAAPAALGCWGLIRLAGRDHAWQPGPVTELLTLNLAGVATIAAVLAAVTLAVTGPLARRLPTPHRLPLAVAWTGTAASVAMGITALVLVALSLVVADWPLAVAAGALAAVSHAVVAASARTCRRCARLPVA